MLTILLVVFVYSCVVLICTPENGSVISEKEREQIRDTQRELFYDNED